MTVYGSSSGGGGAYYPPVQQRPRRVRFETISEAWNLLTQQWGAWVGAMAIYLIIIFGLIGVFFGVLVGVMGIGSSGAQPGQPTDPAIGVGMVIGYLVFWIITLVVSAYFMGGLYRMALKQVRGGTVAVGDLFSAGDSVGPLIATALLTALVTGIGAMFCYLPGIIAAGLLMLAFLIVLDQRVGAVEAMKRSWNTLKADLWMATAYYFVITLLASLGAYVCGVGMLFSFPLLFLGTALVYRDFFDDGTEAGNTAGPGPSIQMPAPPPSASPGAFDL